MAHAPLNKWDHSQEFFLKVLDKTIGIAQSLDCQLIVAHPSNGKLGDVQGFLDEIVRPMLDEADMILCWETFLGHHRFLRGFEDLADFALPRPEFAVCYDTAHLRRDTAETCANIKEYTPVIGVFHVSNWKFRRQHLRLGDGEIDFHKVFKTMAEQYDGPIILEYLKEFHPYLMMDSQRVRYRFQTGKRPDGANLTKF